MRATRQFNTRGLCVPEQDYMVDPAPLVAAIVRQYIEPGHYFTMNRSRQVGKTTTLEALRRALAPAYTVVMENFEGRAGLFDSPFACATGLLRTFARATRQTDATLADALAAPVDPMLPFDDLSDRISQACSRMGRPVVWLIDEVDRASDYDVFAALLGLLREKYLARKAAGAATFHSVVLAGVHDIKNLKRRIRSDSEHAYNSPWNIAVPFTLDLSFTVAQIAALLRDYDADHGTGMDTCLVAGAVHHATNGYPFLVSRLCEILHNERFGWQHDGVGRAVDVLLHEDSTLFDDLAKNLGRNDGLSSLVEAILVRGEDIAFNRLDPAIALGAMYGILAERDGLTVVSNRIFESLIYGYLVSTSRTTGLIAANHDDRGVFIRDGRLDMAAVITRFSDFLVSEYRHADGPFIESHLRLIFLSWLTPIINGSGHYYVEAETRQNRRMDLVVVYNGIEHIIELKIWSGPADHYRAYEQVADYLDIRGQLEGWLITVTDQTTVPATGITAVNHRGHRLWDAIVAYAQPPGARKPA